MSTHKIPPFVLHSGQSLTVNPYPPDHTLGTYLGVSEARCNELQEAYQRIMPMLCNNPGCTHHQNVPVKYEPADTEAPGYALNVSDQLTLLLHEAGVEDIAEVVVCAQMVAVVVGGMRQNFIKEMEADAAGEQADDSEPTGSTPESMRSAAGQAMKQLLRESGLDPELDEDVRPLPRLLPTATEPESWQISEARFAEIHQQMQLGAAKSFLAAAKRLDLSVPGDVLILNGMYEAAQPTTAHERDLVLYLSGSMREPIKQALREVGSDLAAALAKNPNTNLRTSSDGNDVS